MHHLSVHDLWVIYRLQTCGVRLDIRSAVLEPESPLLLSLAHGLLPRQGRVVTVVLRRNDHGHQQKGFVQLHRRSSLPVMDVLFIAPSLESRSGAIWLWKHLLHEGALVAGQLGAQRVFAHLPESEHAAVEVFRQAGFALYAQDRLYRLDPPEQWPEPPESLLWSPQRPRDSWGIEQLYYAITPAVVQQAEAVGTGQSNGERTPVAWWGSAREGCYVFRQDEEVTGYLRLTPGKRGHWLKMVLHPEASPWREQLLREALWLVRKWPRRPIFSDVRDYEGYLADSLKRLGFRHVMTRQLLVRHTTAPIRVAESQWEMARQAATERATPISSHIVPAPPTKIGEETGKPCGTRSR